MDDQARQHYADERQYQDECWVKFTEMCPDHVPTPEWEAWVKEMDAWNKAAYEAREAERQAALSSDENQN